MCKMRGQDGVQVQPCFSRTSDRPCPHFIEKRGLTYSAVLIYKIWMPFSVKSEGFFCPNSHCTDYGKRGLGNIIIYNKYGRDHRRLLKCRTCNLRFSERRNTFFFGLHTEESIIKEVIMHLLDGRSFREAAAMAGIDKDTVVRIWKRFVAYCEEAMEGLLNEFNIKLEDLILLLYERGGYRKKSVDEPVGLEGFLKRLEHINPDAPKKGLCGNHE